MIYLGDETSLEDMQRYEPDSSSSEEEESSSEEEDSDDDTTSRRSSTTTQSAGFASKLNSIAEAEFRSEVIASLERAWAEGHAVDNAAVELKTLRMASNVPLRKVREAIVEFLLDKIETGEGELRDKVRKVVERWGVLIDAIGGVDAVETIEILQVRKAGQISYFISHVSYRRRARRKRDSYRCSDNFLGRFIKMILSKKTTCGSGIRRPLVEGAKRRQPVWLPTWRNVGRWEVR